MQLIAWGFAKPQHVVGLQAGEWRQREGRAMRLEPCPSPELDSFNWEGIQEVVRSFRRALRCGERPAIEAYIPAGNGHRKALLLELIHEEIDFKVKAGEPSGLDSYLVRFPEIAADPHALGELVAAESELRLRIAAEAPAEPAVAVEETPSAPRPSARIGRYELRDVIGQGAFGVVHRAWDTTLKRVVALKRPRPGTLDTRGAVERFLREARSAATLAPSPHRHRCTTPANSTASRTWSAPWSRAGTSPTSSTSDVPDSAGPPNGSPRWPMHSSMPMGWG